MTTQTQHPAYRQGRRAAHNGMPKEINPYKDGTEAKELFDQGWEDERNADDDN